MKYDKDEDVRDEETQVRAGKTDQAAIVLQHLKKTYKTYEYGIIHDASRDFTAVNGIWLHIEGNAIFPSTPCDAAIKIAASHGADGKIA